MLEFTTVQTTCDSCKRPSKAGFYFLHNDTPVLYDCNLCINRSASQALIKAAIEAHKAEVLIQVA